MLQYYKVIRVFVCLKLNNFGTGGPIWLNGMVLDQKNPDPGSGFSENPENPILAGNYKFFSNILSSEAEGQSHFQKRRRGAVPVPR